MGETMLNNGGVGQHHHHQQQVQQSAAVALTKPTPASACPVACPVLEEFHQWKEIHTYVLALKVQDAYKLVFVQEKFMLDVYAGRKTYKYVASPWALDSDSGCQKRIITYTMTLGSIGLKSANSTETQVLSRHNRAGEVYIVSCEITNEGVPLSDNFSINLHICLVRASPPESATESYPSNATEWCRYSIYATIKYKKSVWGMLKGQLERSAYSGMEAVHKDVTTALREYAEALMSEGSGAAEVHTMQTRRKRRTKTASTDLSSRFKKSSKSESNWTGILVNTSFVLLFVVLLAVNLLLYMKVAGLEGVIGDEDHSAQQPKQQSFSLNSPEDTAGSLKDLINIGSVDGDGGGIWVQVSRILERQEKLYFRELEDMGNHLSEAASALDTAEKELHEVLERLPKTMEIILETLKRQEKAVDNEHSSHEQQPSLQPENDSFAN